MNAADDALEKLKAGNQRFVAGQAQPRGSDGRFGTARAEGQSPFAIVLSCSDSRVPPEIVFDQDVGALYSIETGEVNFLGA